MSPHILSPAPRSEQSQSALERIGRLRREPSLSPNQQTFSYGSPSSPIGSNIEQEFEGARPTPFQPRLVDTWGSCEPWPPPRVAISDADAGSAIGEPTLSASAGGRLACVHPACFASDVGQLGLGRPMPVSFRPGLAPPVSDPSRQSGQLDCGSSTWLRHCSCQLSVKLAVGPAQGRRDSASSCMPPEQLKASCVSMETQTDLSVLDVGLPSVNFLTVQSVMTMMTYSIVFILVLKLCMPARPVCL